MCRPHTVGYPSCSSEQKRLFASHCVGGLIQVVWWLGFTHLDECEGSVLKDLPNLNNAYICEHLDLNLRSQHAFNVHGALHPFLPGRTP